MHFPIWQTEQQLYLQVKKIPCDKRENLSYPVRDCMYCIGLDRVCTSKWEKLCPDFTCVKRWRVGSLCAGHKLICGSDEISSELILFI